LLDLRPYQREALTRIRDAYREGKRRVLVSLPTGTGKTVIFAHFPNVLRMRRRLLVLAHREELLLQARDKFRAVNPELKVEIEQAGTHASADASVVVASIPTLSRGTGARLAALAPDDFSIIVVDEAHHAVAPTYRRVLEHFGLFEPDTPRYLIGFTATPRRGDQQGLGEVFQEVCYARDLREMIREGYLAPIAGWRVDSEVSLDDVKVRHGDFIESQLARAVNTSSRNALLVRSYTDLAAGRRTIVFCVDVAHVQAAQRAFQEAGIHATAVWGALPRDERRAALAGFASGEFDVITNCNVLTEGFDEPRVDCVIMARPTRSKLLYAQMVGRGTRLHADKSDLLVLDIADNSKTHSLTGLHSLFNLPTTMNLQGRNVLAVERALERIQRTRPWIDTTRIESPQQIRFALERIEFFNFDPPAELADHTGNIWHAVPGGYRLSLPNGEWLAITSNLLDSWDLEHRTRTRSAQIGRESTLSRAVEAADHYLAGALPDARQIVQRFARWRNLGPTDKQKELLGRYGVHVPQGLTRGQAAQMIGMVLSTRS
jgi:ATP-dependent helicase IRC3